MIAKPTIVIHTTYFETGGFEGPDPDRADAVRLGDDLYNLLTRPKNDALAWGAGIPVRIATAPDQVDRAEAKHVVVVPILGGRAFGNEVVREAALAKIADWSRSGARVLPVPVTKNWRTVEAQMAKPLLTELYGAKDARRATLNEILLALARELSGSDAYSSRLFISHAKADLEPTGKAAEKIRAYVTSETTGTAFFDKVSILPGEDLTTQVDGAAGAGVFLAVRGNLYSSRTWCRRELLRAKQCRLPTLTVEVLSSGEERSAVYAGNGPTVVWNRRDRNAAALVMTRAMVEAIRHLFFLEEGTRVIDAAALPDTTERLTRPPELLDLAPLRARPDAAIVVLHPDPPLPPFERKVLEEADSRLKLVTPTTAFADAIGSAIRAPLDGWQVALALSDPTSGPSNLPSDGVTAEHLTDGMLFLARALVGVGAAIAYGGDFRKKGFTHLLAQMIVTFNETASRNAKLLQGYLAATFDPDEAKDLPYTSLWLGGRADVRIPAQPRGQSMTAARRGLYFSDMRQFMASATNARIVLGGKTRPVTHDPNGYLGRFPGVVEEALWTLRAGKPLYVAGGFGGAAAHVAALLSGSVPEELNDATWAGQAEWDALARDFAADPYAKALELPKDSTALIEELRARANPHLASDAASIAWNGLTLAENQTLFTTKDPLTLTALVVKGLIASSTRAAFGKLRVELVEGSVTEASDLELVAFPTFQDVAIDGAGAALDGVTGGAATQAHRTGRVVPSATRAFGAQHLYAADLGRTGDAMQDVVRSVEQAAQKAAEVMRLRSIQRLGVVTFLGNVTGNADVISAMVAGLQHAATGKTEVVWFEQDPARASFLASVLGRDPRVQLTRRAPTMPVPLVPVAPRGRPRTFVTLRLEKDALDAALLLHQPNGLVPVVQSELADAERRGLAGKATDRAPASAELDRRGRRIAELLFGRDASSFLERVGDSELVLTHDDAASAIPYEAMSWTVGNRTVTPALEGGIVRHLLARGVAPDSALTRPPRTGSLGVLVIVNPLGDLDGAEAEGKALLAELRKSDDYKVTTLLREEATIDAVRRAIADPGIDVLHYCGHAFFNGPGPEGSGLNCADGPLTVAELRNLRSVPRLAFVNACQAGRVRGAPLPVREPQAFAELFLRAGVDAYLGAFWLVSDAGAAAFAATVYAAMRQGRDLGAAVVEGRKALKDKSNNDWANYVLYGDVGFRLSPARAATATPPPDRGATPPADSVPKASGPGDAPAPTVRVDGTTIVAAWAFAADVAPTSFTVVAVDADTGEPVRVAEPMRIDRRESWSGIAPLVTWVATLHMTAPLERTIQLRPSTGEAVDIAPAARSSSTAGATRSAAAGPATTSSLRALQALLDQQPDGGHSLLRVLQPSANPVELRAALDLAVEQEAAGPVPAEPARGIWPFKGSVHVDQRRLDEFCEAYNLPPIERAKAENQDFQTKEDWQRYATASGAIAFTAGADVLPPIWRDLQNPAAQLTHDVRTEEFASGSFEAALFADNGNGLHASLAIAKQIVNSNLPYAFHLGDVYYGGAQAEFENYFDGPLRAMFDRTELFMITGNHEMYAKGHSFQEMIRGKAKKHPQRQRQRGEMFCLRGPGFKILGVDTMFVGWNARRPRVHDRADRDVLNVLETWLKDDPNALTILLTTNEPWNLGTEGFTPLYDSLRATIADRVDLWFWGNVHYAALYEPWGFADLGARTRHLVGTCIGHGGYPFYTQGPKVGDLPAGVGCRWLEKKSRFWPDAHMRPDVGANGWCRLKLQRTEKRWGVTLTYVDWVGRPRLVADLVRDDGGTIHFTSVKESDAAGVGAPLTWQDVPGF